MALHDSAARIMRGRTTTRFLAEYGHGFLFSPFSTAASASGTSFVAKEYRLVVDTQNFPEAGTSGKSYGVDSISKSLYLLWSEFVGTSWPKLPAALPEDFPHFPEGLPRFPARCCRQAHLKWCHLSIRG